MKNKYGQLYLCTADEFICSSEKFEQLKALYDDIPENYDFLKMNIKKIIDRVTAIREEINFLDGAFAPMGKILTVFERYKLANDSSLEADLISAYDEYITKL